MVAWLPKKPHTFLHITGPSGVWEVVSWVTRSVAILKKNPHNNHAKRNERSAEAPPNAVTRDNKPPCTKTLKPHNLTKLVKLPI